MPSRSPFVARVFRFLLAGIGATAVVSSSVNLFATWRLVAVEDELATGLSRGELIGSYGVLLFVGVVLVYLGVRRQK